MIRLRPVLGFVGVSQSFLRSTMKISYNSRISAGFPVSDRSSLIFRSYSNLPKSNEDAKSEEENTKSKQESISLKEEENKISTAKTPQNLQKLDEQITQNIVKSHVIKHIPGESPQTNTILDRIPKFPFKKEAVPKLIPKPGIPVAGSNLKNMVQTLNSKDKPELIYESESHRLYFIFCGSFALVALIYGLIFLEWALDSAYSLYKENDMDLSPVQNFMLYMGRNIVTLSIFAFPAAIATLFIIAPTRLIRRMWYIPVRANEQKNNTQPFVRFTSHPFFPGRPTPVYTMPLSMLNRSFKTKIFTNEGFYLTLDKGSFMFLLKEGTKKIPWIVDRQGFFWGDGRVFDHFFGKESIEEAEKGISYDDKVGAVNERIRQEKKRLRIEKGSAWRLKEKGQLVNKDISKLVAMVKKKNDKEPKKLK